jgi:hypothetical protein
MISNTITLISSGIVDSDDTLDQLAKSIYQEYQKLKPSWKPLKQHKKPIGVVLLNEPGPNIQLKPLKVFSVRELQYYNSGWLDEYLIL